MTTPEEHAPPQQFHVLFALHSAQMLPRDELERLTIHAEEAVNTAMPELGASATAVFEQTCIEFDMLIDASTAAELHRRIADVMSVLEGAGFFMMLVSSKAFASLDHEPDDELVPA